jgi:hypothetical protein
MDSQQAIKVDGTDNQVITVGNDLVIANNYVQQKTDFFKPKLDPYKSPPFVSPENISELATTLYTQRMIILGGSPEVDKDELARHLAWYLSSRIEQEKKDGLEHVEIMEWHHNSDRQSLIIGIQEEKKPAIFILPQISPTDVAYDPARLQMEARKNGHFVILSTEQPYSAWKISGNGSAPVYWVELSPESLYSPAKLTDALIDQLLNALELLPESLSKVDFEPDTPLAGKITIGQAASQLKTPKNIAFFVELLCQKRRPLTEANVEEWLNVSHDSSRVFAQWFLSSLRPHEQTAALGLGLFEGLLDDQYFAALEEVTEAVWRGRDPHIIFPDYCDLENLGSFYNFVETQDGGFKINSKIPRQRKLLFDLVWKSYRRKLQVSLPVISRLAIQSISDWDKNPTLYGSNIRRNTLRDAIGESLSEVGLISPAAVEECLLQLASNQNFEVQVIAAKAMARWREFDRDKELFEMLQRWQTEARLINIVKAIIEGRDEKDRNSPEAQVRATVAVTTGQAALYDPPNQLSKELVKLFLDLADDANELVRDRFRGYTLPTILSQHLNQVSKDLREIVRYIDLIQAVGASLARAYRVVPEDVICLLDEWYEECEKNRPTQINQNEITHRDAMLATVILTYGQINYGEGNQQLKASEAFKRLLAMLEKERHNFIRTAIAIAITFQARYHFEMVEEQLKWLLPEVTPKEREDLVKILNDIYMEQRAKLEGGDDKMQLRNQTYPIWNDSSKRPLTKVEQALYRWLESDSNVAARQIATQAFIVFAIALDEPEREFRDKKKAEADRKKNSTSQGTPLSQIQFIRSTREITFVQRTAAFLATLNAVELRPLINDLVPEASLHFKSHRKATELVIEKWKESPSSTLSRAATRLRSAVGLVANASAIIVVLLAIGFLFLCILMNQ